MAPNVEQKHWKRRPVERVADEFWTEAEKIRIAYQAAIENNKVNRIESRYVRPWDTAENIIKRESYRLISKTLSKTSGRAAIKSIVKNDRIEPREPFFESNPFYWGLLAINPFDHEKTPNMKISLYAPLLHYAHQHNVPPAYLIGFLHQVGSSDDIRRLYKDQKREVGFLAIRSEDQLIWL